MSNETENYIASIDQKKITDSARVSARWDSYGIAVDLNYSCDKALGYGEGVHCFCEPYVGGKPNQEAWEEALHIAQALRERYGLPLDILKDELFLKKQTPDLASAFAQILEDCHFFGIAKEYKDFPSWVVGEGIAKVADEIMAGWGTDGSITGNMVHQMLDANIRKSNEELQELLVQTISEHMQSIQSRTPSLKEILADANKRAGRGPAGPGGPPPGGAGAAAVEPPEEEKKVPQKSAFPLSR